MTQGGVERSVPSTCGQKKCPASSNNGGHCSQIDVDKEPPHVKHCPGDCMYLQNQFKGFSLDLRLLPFQCG